MFSFQDIPLRMLFHFVFLLLASWPGFLRNAKNAAYVNSKDKIYHLAVKF